MLRGFLPSRILWHHDLLTRPVLVMRLTSSLKPGPRCRAPRWGGSGVAVSDAKRRRYAFLPRSFIAA